MLTLQLSEYEAEVIRKVLRHRMHLRRFLEDAEFRTATHLDERVVKALKGVAQPEEKFIEVKWEPEPVMPAKQGGVNASDAAVLGKPVEQPVLQVEARPAVLIDRGTPHNCHYAACLLTKAGHGPHPCHHKRCDPEWRKRQAEITKAFWTPERRAAAARRGKRQARRAEEESQREDVRLTRCEYANTRCSWRGSLLFHDGTDKGCGKSIPAGTWALQTEEAIGCLGWCCAECAKANPHLKARR